MSDPVFELQKLCDELKEYATSFNRNEILKPLTALGQAADEADKAWSGSWMGYHAYVYYDNLQVPPAGASFSVEWGLKGPSSRFGYHGQWRQFAPQDIEKAIQEKAGNPDISPAKKSWRNGSKLFQAKRTQLLSILYAVLEERQDPFLAKRLEDTETQRILKSQDFVMAWRPTSTIATRDMAAVTQGLKVPPQLSVLSDIKSLQEPARGSLELVRIAMASASHLERLARNERRSDRIGTNVFIGHGRSSAWRDLKDFIAERMRLPWDEFNRVPVAGVTNIARLSEMLDAAAIAFIIMTAEDERADGKVHARLNVVHEAGLFQGRLGFTKAILLLEKGCEEFSNIQGLGQIRFPQGNVKASFEEIRRVLERESLINT